uniref:Uncharacterized protein n=1 Tax=Anguilla anguilla TaxID=7936 RepID=A0A0E9QBP4_ANGAN
MRYSTSVNCSVQNGFHHWSHDFGHMTLQLQIPEVSRICTG